jgi:hypothetical protein
LGDAPAEAIKVGAEKEETMKRKLRQAEAITLFPDTFVDSHSSFIDNKFFARTYRKY